MKIETLTPGSIVRNRAMTDWGLGKVLLVEGNKASVYFKGVPGTAAEAIKTLRTDIAPLELAEQQSDPWLDNLPPFVKDGRIVAPTTVRLTHDQAVERFIRQYPGRFEDPQYLAQERDYKWLAHQTFKESLGPDWIGELTGRDDIHGGVQRIKKAAQSVNLLSPFELMALGDGLKDLAAAGTYLDALGALLSSGRVTEASFTQLANAVSALPAEKGKARVFTWPVVTLLPFLAAPQTFMFLKPGVTKVAAERLAFDLLYDPTPQWRTYSRLLEMSTRLMELLRPLGARDMIDVQSFIWVTARS